MVIVLITGSSASGKTTIAKLLEKHHQFHLIDGDQVIKDLGLTSKSWISIHHCLIDRALQFDTDAKVVISHVVLPEKFEYYQDILAKAGRTLKIIVLKPSLQSLQQRNLVRKSHPKPTPVIVIDFFYQKFLEINPNTRNWFIVDSSLQDSAETARQIVDYCGISTTKL